MVQSKNKANIHTLFNTLKAWILRSIARQRQYCNCSCSSTWSFNGSQGNCSQESACNESRHHGRCFSRGEMCCALVSCFERSTLTANPLSHQNRLQHPKRPKLQVVPWKFSSTMPLICIQLLLLLTLTNCECVCVVRLVQRERECVCLCLCVMKWNITDRELFFKQPRFCQLGTGSQQ